MIKKLTYKMKPPVSAKPRKSILKKLGCVGLWIMNEKGGSVVFDLSGNGGHGIISVFNWVSSKYGSGLGLSTRSDQVITLPTGFKPLDGLSKFTIIAHVNLDIVTWDRDIFVTDNHGSASIKVILWADNAVIDHFAFYLDTSDGNTGSLYGSTEIIPNTDYEVAITYDGSFVRMYVNGVAEGGSFPNAHTGTVDATTKDNYRIGNDEDLSRELLGIIDCFSLFNRDFSIRDIQQHYARPYSMFDRPARPLYHVAGGEPPAITPLFMDLGTWYWTIKKASGLYTRL